MTQEKTWCVASDEAPINKLQTFLDFCCAHLSCAEINPGGTCFVPDTLKDHASYALNLYFKIYGQCDHETGVQTNVNPCELS